MLNTNYNTTTDFYKINENILSNLKVDIKNILNLTRTPRNLDIFFNFFKACKLQMKTNSPVYISTLKLQKAFGIKSSDYKIYFEKLVAEWESEEYQSYGKDKTCRLIKSFTEEFISLCQKYHDLKLPRSFYQKYYYNIKEFSESQLNRLRTLFKKEEREEKSISSTLRNIDSDDLLIEDFYHSTEDSPFRVYHKLQSVTRATKSDIFNGYYDIDLQQCFASIAWHILDMKNCDLAYSWLLNPEFKHDLRQLIKKDFNLDSIEDAKKKVCALFTDEWTTGEKNVEWYQQLHNEIKKRVKTQLGQKVLWRGKEEVIDSFHKFFTYHEQMIIEKLSQNLDVVLNMHDGIIATNKPNQNSVEYLGFEFLLSINQFVKIEMIEDDLAIQMQSKLEKMQYTKETMEINKDYKEEYYTNDIQKHSGLIVKNFINILL